MEQFISWNYKIIKGRELKKLGLYFVKITPKNMWQYNLFLKVGENISKCKLSKIPGGLGLINFYPINTFVNFFKYGGDGYHEVTFADDEEIFIDDNQCKARKVILSEKIKFHDMDYNLCKFVVSQDGSCLFYLNNNMKNDPEICKIAITNTTDAYKYIKIDV
jgi:hypothetical protein